MVFSQTVQLIGTSTWSKPYFESYLYHSIWVLILPLAYSIYFVEKKFSGKGDAYPKIPYRELLLWAAFSGPAILLTSWFYYMMEARVTLSVASAMVQCYFLIIFALSFLLLGERITLIKVSSSVICVAGLVLVAVSGLQSDDGSGNLICCGWSGYLYLVASMIISALYQVMWAVIMDPVKGPFGRGLSLSFFGISFVGISALVIGWLGIVIGHFSGWEPFELPPAGVALDSVLIVCSMDFLLNLANLLAIFFINPTFVTVGGLLAIPLNIISQWIFYSTLPLPVGWGGMILIIFGCFLFETGDWLLNRLLSRSSAPPPLSSADGGVRFFTEDQEELLQQAAN